MAAVRINLVDNQIVEFPVYEEEELLVNFILRLDSTVQTEVYSRYRMNKVFHLPIGYGY